MTVLRFDDFLLDTERRQLLRGAEEVHLPPRTFRLLEVLLEERPRAVSKRDLMQRVWPDVIVEESNLKTIVSELRAALGDAKYIRTVHRYGYAFSGDVRSDEAPSSSYRLYGDDVRLALSRAEVIIGRHPRCDVWIDSPDISREHARISVRADGILIEDLGSKNGTWVGDERIAGPTMLKDGDRIRVADVTLIFRAPTDDQSTRSAG